MVEWEPRPNMRYREWLKFKLGAWAEVDSVPEWVQDASDPPRKTRIPANGSVSATFTGNSLKYKVVTKRVPRGAGTNLEVEYYARIKK